MGDAMKIAAQGSANQIFSTTFWVLGSTPTPEARIPKSATRNPKLETRSPRPETLNPKPSSRNAKP
jgi:hypothetical protein